MTPSHITLLSHRSRRKLELKRVQAGHLLGSSLRQLASFQVRGTSTATPGRGRKASVNTGDGGTGPAEVALREASEVLQVLRVLDLVVTCMSMLPVVPLEDLNIAH